MLEVSCVRIGVPRGVPELYRGVLWSLLPSVWASEALFRIWGLGSVSDLGFKV